MKIDFSEEKNIINWRKHNISLADANMLEWDTLLCIPDDRQDYGEERFIGYALIGARLYCVVFTDRANVRRIISLRKANKREVMRYANQG